MGLSKGTKEGQFRTIDGKVVFMGGPSSGAGGVVSATVPESPEPATYDPNRSAASLEDMVSLIEKVGSKETAITAKRISEVSGVPLDEVEGILNAWEGSSNANSVSRAIQEESTVLFGTRLSDYQRRIFGQEYTQGDDLSRETARKVLQAMYATTQEELQKAGFPEHVTLHRGLSFDSLREASITPNMQGTVQQIYENALSSFTADAATASGFAFDSGKPHGAVIEMQVPRSRILSFSGTGLGTYGEYEVVVIGNNSGVGDEMFIEGAE